MLACIIAGSTVVPLMQPVGWMRNLKFGQGAGDNSPTLHEGHPGGIQCPPSNDSRMTPAIMSERQCVH